MADKMIATTAPSTDLTLRDKLNGSWHRPALRVFSVIVLAHLAEHIVQAYQVYVLGYPLMEARGILGQWFPWLIHSEVMHYGYALIMLIGLWLFLPGFVGRARQWWPFQRWKAERYRGRDRRRASDPPAARVDPRTRLRAP